jgi:hypothetical protein
MMSTEPDDKLFSLRNALTPADQPALLVQIEGFVEEMADLALRTEQLIPSAEEFEITSEAEYQFADDIRVELLGEAKRVDEQRLAMTRPLDTFRAYIKQQADSATEHYHKAAAIYGQKAMAYRRAEQAKAEAARREAERIQREAQARLEAEARRKEAAAAKLKTEAARQRAQEEADALRMAAQHTPTAFVESAPPQTSSSNVQAVWLWKVSDKKAFLHWLADNPMEHGVIDFKKRPMDILAARAGKSGQEIPGLTIESSEKFVKKAHRA